MILLKVKETTESYLDTALDFAVVNVPAYFITPSNQALTRGNDLWYEYAP